MKKSIQTYLETLSDSEQKTVQDQIDHFLIEDIPLQDYPLSPLETIKLSTQDEHVIGTTAIHDEPLGIILLAGGMGSRLNFSKPKGLFPITVVEKKPLIQLFFEHITALKNAYETEIAVGILLDRQSHADIADFLKEHSFFGFCEKNITYLLQKETPYLYEGDWFLESRLRIATAPNGNGGLFDADGLDSFFEKLSKQSMRNTIIMPIDNPFLFQVHPHVLGKHILSEADITCTGIERDETNPMGLFASGEQGPVIIDYPILKKNQIRDTFHYGNVNCFCCTTSFLKKGKSLPLPTHQILKKTKKFDPISNEHTVIEAIKTEKFITDLTLFAQKTSLALLPKEQAYAPLKTAEDIAEIQKKLLAFDTTLLIQNEVSYTGDIELHPRYHYLSEKETQKALNTTSCITGYLD